MQLPYIDSRRLYKSIIKRCVNRINRIHGLKPGGKGICVATVHLGDNIEEYHNSAEKHASREAGLMGIKWINRKLSPSILAKDILTSTILSSKQKEENVNGLSNLNLGPAEIYQMIASLNMDPDITGIIIARPTPEHLSLREIHQSLHPLKDIEGMHPTNIGLVVYGNEINQTNSDFLLPCTASAAVEVVKEALIQDELIEKAKQKGIAAQDRSTIIDSVPEAEYEAVSKKIFRGIEALVVGNSDILAKPICSLLHAAGATVSIIPSDHPKFPAFGRAADVVFLAASDRPRFVVTGDMLKPGCALVDIGFNTVPYHKTHRHRQHHHNHQNHASDLMNSVSAGGQGLRIIGDADLDSCGGVVKHLCTINRGIGLVRTAILLDNITKAAEMQWKASSKRPATNTTASSSTTILRENT